MGRIRTPAVAGMFYPGDAGELRREVERYLHQAVPPPVDEPPPKAIIAPHAGYIYSGAVAGSAYARLQAVRAAVRRVVLLGPSHRVGFRGLAASSADTFVTPLGSIPVDVEGVALALTLRQVQRLDEAHLLEHSLEVQLPFLQQALDAFTLLPLVVGDAPPAEVAEVLELLWGGDETLIVVSSDLSHYHDYETARRMDSATSRAIEELRPDGVGFDDACGRNPVNGLLVAARKRGMTAATIDLRNSGDTAGPRNQVVGYGAYLFH